MKESGNDYTKFNPNGGKIGALGRYQLTDFGLIDTGYVDKNRSWTGKNNIYSKDDFLNNPEVQEKAFDDYMKKQYDYLNNVKAFDYSGEPLHGIKSDFNISDTGLLAAAHRAGYNRVKNYLNTLEKNSQGQYYINYDSLTDRDDIDWFPRIETRLREFEK